MDVFATCGRKILIVGSSEKCSTSPGAGRMRGSLARPSRARDLRVQSAVVAQPGRRVDRGPAVRMDFEVQVRAGGVTGHPDRADLVSGVHGLADRHAELRHVVVPGYGAVLVPDLDLAAVGAGPVG